MTFLLPCAAAVVGLLAGAYLRTWVFHLSVPSGTPARTRCPGCGARLFDDPRRPGRPLPASGRCRGCRWRIGPRHAVLELGTAAAFGTLAVLVGPKPELLAYAVLAALGVALVAIDVAVRRLPDALVLPAYPVVFGTLAAAALIDGKPLRILSALLGLLVLGGGFLLLGMLRRGELGGGDVKVAGLVGMPVGWASLGWAGTLGPLATGVLAYLMFGGVTLALLYFQRADWFGKVQLGPFILAGAFAVLLAGGRVPVTL